MRRIAYFSPLPPDASGIADYSAELLPALREHFEIDVFAPRHRQARRLLDSVQPVSAVSAYEKAAARRGYDAVVYQLGNVNRFHGEIYRVLLRHPGIVVLHEFMLHHLIRGLAVKRGGALGFVEEMRYCYGAAGARTAVRLVTGEISVDPWRFPLFERAVDASLGVLVHSRAVRDRLRVSRPNVRVAVIPHHLSLHGRAPATDLERAAVRESLDLAEDTFLVASFGHLNPAKRLELTLSAFARFRRRVPGAVLLLVGQIPAAYRSLPELLSGALSEGVVVTGRVDLNRFLELMAGCDVAVNLRHPTGGETSGSCMRLLGLGRPVIVSNAGWFAEIPDDCCAKVATGPTEEEHLLAVLEALASAPELRAQMGLNARRWIREHHRLEDSARGYARFIEKIVAEAPRPYRPVPPLTDTTRGDILTALITDITGEAVELGIGEEQDAFLREVSRSLVDLNLDAAG